MPWITPLYRLLSPGGIRRYILCLLSSSLGNIEGNIHILLPITVEPRSKRSRLGNLFGDGCDPNRCESHVLDIIELAKVGLLNLLQTIKKGYMTYLVYNPLPAATAVCLYPVNIHKSKDRDRKGRPFGSAHKEQTSTHQSEQNDLS